MVGTLSLFFTHVERERAAAIDGRQGEKQGKYVANWECSVCGGGRGRGGGGGEGEEGREREEGSGGKRGKPFVCPLHLPREREREGG